MNKMTAEGFRKYGNRKATVDGITFDSVKEAVRYRELKLLERAGEIHDLKLQEEYKLIPAQYENGRLIERKCSYIADFDYIDKNGVHIVEDTKGMRTKEYIIKRKLMLYIFHIRITEI